MKKTVEDIFLPHILTGEVELEERIIKVNLKTIACVYKGITICTIYIYNKLNKIELLTYNNFPNMEVVSVYHESNKEKFYNDLEKINKEIVNLNF